MGWWSRCFREGEDAVDLPRYGDEERLHKGQYASSGSCDRDFYDGYKDEERRQERRREEREREEMERQQLEEEQYYRRQRQAEEEEQQWELEQRWEDERRAEEGPHGRD